MLANRRTMRNPRIALLTMTILMAIGGITKADFTFGTPVNMKSLIPVLSSMDHTFFSFTADGREIYILWWWPDGVGSDIAVLKRDSIDANRPAPEELGPAINDPNGAYSPYVPPDGLELYFAANRSGGYGGGDLWMSKRASLSAPWETPILPIVDFDANGKLDLVDLAMLIDNWGSNKTLYDIGPCAWGDGKVDVEDLKVFINHRGQEKSGGKP